jgi:quercetin dioxygenase-like cupin family protein
MTSEEYYRALYGKEPPADPVPSQALKILKVDDIVWKNHPFLPLQVCDMLGDPAKKDLFMAFVKFPSHYTLPAHFHPYDEAITVLKGTYHCQIGTEDFTLKPGESLIVP